MFRRWACQKLFAFYQPFFKKKFHIPLTPETNLCCIAAQMIIGVNAGEYLLEKSILKFMILFISDTIIVRYQERLNN